MERIMFIHGSSVGQSALIPTDDVVAKKICNDIANKYFGGRILRQKESATKLGLFVDLYKSAQGEIYSVYSFVNNSCRGAASSENSKGRDGQYFAMSILCKGKYVYPEELYGVLSSAYNQIVKTGKVIIANKDGEDQYVIPQFEEQRDYLNQILKKVGEFFDQVSGGTGKGLPLNSKVADYDSWSGVKVNLDICNSTDIYKQLCETGRAYISEEYESSSKRIKALEADVQRLKIQKNDVENRLAETARSEKSKVRDEIEDLAKQVQQKDSEIQKLKLENEDYKGVINTVRNELEKYAKVGKSITKAQEKETHYQSKSNKDLLKLCLLFLILLLTILIGLMNYLFFRDFSPFSKQEVKQEIFSKQGMSETKETKTEQKNVQNVPTNITISPDELVYESEGGEQSIIVTGGEWDVPVPAPNQGWIQYHKEAGNKLSVKVQSNELNEPRSATFMIKDKQIRITQKGKVVVARKKAPVCPDYIIEVTDDEGRKLKPGDIVESGQILIAKIQNPDGEGCGWKCDNCTSPSKDKNHKEARITVGTDSKKSVVFSYGNLNNSELRKKFYLKLQATDPTEANNPTAENAESTPVAPETTVNN